MLDNVRLFPPQVLSDLNFFNVNSEKELALRLRTLQRVASAAIGAYFCVRYESILAAKLGSGWVAGGVVMLSFLAGYGCLSFPAVSLITAGIGGHLSIKNAVTYIRNKEIGWAVINVVGVGYAYFASQIYRDPTSEDGDPDLEPGPNFLERLFQKVEDQITQPLWDRFYKK